jgi:hypothetical protein
MRNKATEMAADEYPEIKRGGPAYNPSETTCVPYLFHFDLTSSLRPLSPSPSTLGPRPRHGRLKVIWTAPSLLTSSTIAE